MTPEPENRMPFQSPPRRVSAPTRPRHRGGHVRAGLFTALLLMGSTAAAQPAAPPAKPSALNNGSAAEASAYYKKLARKLNFLTPETIESKATMQEMLNYLGYSELSPEVVEFEAPEKLMGGGSDPATASAFPYCGKPIELKSWKGDSLNRPDTAQGVTSSSTGTGNIWIAECVGDKVRLKSSKGDYLHRPDSNQGVTTWHTGIGNDWEAEFTNGKLMLKSWKGDYLHRPDNVQGVTTWHTGIGNQWTVVEHSTGSASSTVLAAGSIISLQSDLGTWLTRCPGCMKTVNNVDATSVHTQNDPASSPTARFTVVDAGNGKIALKADSGMFLARCRGCVSGSSQADTLTVHVSGSAPPPTYAQFTPERLPNGKIALKSDLGRYVARCRNCVVGSTVADTVTIHATNPNTEPYAQWTVLQHTSGSTTTPPSLKKGDILVSRFFAPKIVNFAVAPEQRNIGWRRLLRINSRPNSEAAKHHVESAWILFNHFTSPPVHSPYGGTPPTEQLKDSSWGQVKITTPGNMKNSSVNTQVALVTHCTASQEECAEVDSIYWVDFGPSAKGYKLSYQLDAFFDAGNLVAAGDTPGVAPYFVPNGCDTCHGSLKGQAILNLLDTDHWMDRVTDGDFPALARPDAPAPLFDAGKDTKSPQYAAAFDIIRTLNREIADMQRRVNNQSFQLAATDKWLQLHQSTVQPEPDLVTRAFEFANLSHPLHKTRKPTPTPLTWGAKAEDKELLGLLNKYCYRCHGAIRFDVFSKDLIADQTSPMLDRIDPNPTQAKVVGFKMPPDRDLPAKDKQRLLDLLDQLDQQTH